MELSKRIQVCIIQNGKIALLEQEDKLKFPAGSMRKGETKILAASRIAFFFTGLKVRVLPIGYSQKSERGSVMTLLAYPVSEKIASRRLTHNVLWENINNLERRNGYLKKDIIRIKQKIAKANMIKRAGLLVYKVQKNKIKFLFISSLMNSNRFIIPQGHVEEGETYEIAAVRETQEEAGVNAEIREKLGFFFLERGKNIYETHIFLARFNDLVDTDENRIIKWLSYDEIMKKDILRETKIFIRDVYCNKKKRKFLK